VRLGTEVTAVIADLDARHLDVLRLIAVGYTNEQIGKLNGVSQTTVERWCTDIFRSLGINTRGTVNPRVEATRRYISVAGIPDRP
jgi:DNA-binding NarL/FixJ family response regulator